MRVEHDYRRGGALAYLAAWDVHRDAIGLGAEPIVFSRCGRRIASLQQRRPCATFITFGPGAGLGGVWTGRGRGRARGGVRADAVVGTDRRVR